MIIEIKDLPQGQKIKKILFEFDSDVQDTILVQTGVEEPQEITKISGIPKNKPLVKESKETKESISMPVIPDSVQMAEVPEEMTNLEF